MYKRIIEGILPKVLERVADPEVKMFIAVCLQHEASRPSAEELLNHEFLRIDESDPKM
jgi:hypothetical protein